MTSINYKTIYTRLRLWIIPLTAFLSITILLYCLRMTFISVSPKIVCKQFILAAAEASVMTLPVIWLHGKWRRLVIIPVWIVTFFTIANLLYFYNFHDIIPSGFYSLSFSYNEFVAKSLKNSFHWRYLLYLIPAIITTIVAFSDKSNSRLSRRKILVAILATAILFTGYCSSLIRGLNNFAKIESTDLSTAVSSHWYDFCAWYLFFFDFGTYGLSAKIIEDKFIHNIHYSDQQIHEAIKAISNPILPSLDDDMARALAGNRSKNLIIIETESLITKVLELPYFDKVAPTLYSLSNDSSVLLVPDLKVTINKGRSSDAQFTLNTGLPSLQDYIVAMDYYSAQYPSLADALSSHKSYELIGESSQTWNHALTSKSFGFSHLYEGLTNSYSEFEDDDKIIFQKSFNILRNFPSPFFAFITTYSMHDPYLVEDFGLPVEKLLPRDLDPRDRSYMLAVAVYDSALSELLYNLKKSGIYDNSVIVITGDHEARHSEVSTLLQDHRVPFFVINSGLNPKYTRPSGSFSQEDIFPTILDLMGITSYRPTKLDAEYRGVGSSILRKPYRPLSDSLRIAGQTLIKSRFFVLNPRNNY